MLRILTLTGHYLPGYLAGGPIRSISNLVEHLGDEFQFYVIAADRDLGQDKFYPGIRRGQWNEVGKAKVRYLSPAEMRSPAWLAELRGIEYDLLYLNSFFLPQSIGFMIMRKLNLIARVPVLMAPRGQFSEGALSLKSPKKRAYLVVARRFQLYSDVCWQASSDYEKDQIRNIFRTQLMSGGDIHVVPNLPPLVSQATTAYRQPTKQIGSARVIFLSRISRKKNLDVALRLLSKVKGEILFEIFGPLEDMPYWRECERIITQLPDNITVAYRGHIHPDEVVAVFSKYHLFLFPTRGENYGHVILEALRAGCLVLTSDQTPWRNLSHRQIGWDISLSNTDGFLDALNVLATMDQVTFNKWSEAAAAYSRSIMGDPGPVEAHRQMFNAALATCGSKNRELNTAIGK